MLRQLGQWLARTQDANAQRLFEAALAKMPHGFCMFDADKRLVLCNHRYAKLYGLPAALVKRGTALQDIISYREGVGNAPVGFPNYVSHDGVEWSDEGNSVFEFQLQDGRTIRLNHLALSGGGYVATHEDVTDAVRAAHRANFMAKHDLLTGLPNRSYFRASLRDVLRGISPMTPVAVLSLDVDNFAAVNDALGHGSGDLLLTEAARRLGSSIGASDIMARIGGDEFCVAQLNGNQPRDASALAERIVEALSQPCALDGHEIPMSVSVGVAIAPDNGEDADGLIRNADLALYRVKSEGGGAFCFFEPAMHSSLESRHLLEVSLRRAIAQREFELHYQPLIDIARNAITGFEALLRWRDPARGLVSPGEFIPFAEEKGLIIPLGEWAVRKACADAAKWPGDLSVAVNLSAVQFRNEDIVGHVFRALAESHLQPRRLELEITESVLLKDSSTTIATLHKLRQLGVRISMDDFGTGYSSLAYLRSFPFDKIKIDQSFVRDLSEDRGDALAIVRAICALGTAFNVSILAEGVETQSQLDCLRREGCTEAQGFLFSRPRPLSDLAEMLHNPTWIGAETSRADNVRQLNVRKLSATAAKG